MLVLITDSRVKITTSVWRPFNKLHFPTKITASPFVRFYTHPRNPIQNKHEVRWPMNKVKFVGQRFQSIQCDLKIFFLFLKCSFAFEILNLTFISQMQLNSTSQKNPSKVQSWQADNFNTGQLQSLCQLTASVTSTKPHWLLIYVPVL